MKHGTKSTTRELFRNKCFKRGVESFSISNYRFDWTAIKGRVENWGKIKWISLLSWLKATTSSGCEHCTPQHFKRHQYPSGFTPLLFSKEAAACTSKQEWMNGLNGVIDLFSMATVDNSSSSGRGGPHESKFLLIIRKQEWFSEIKPGDQSLEEIVFSHINGWQITTP